MFTRDIGIDLGTANTIACAKDKGVIMREPSVVAYDVKTHHVLAVGTEAKEMIGRTPGSVVAVKPLIGGVIADYEVTVVMLRRFIKNALKGSLFSRVRVVICVPAGATEVESRAVRDAAKLAGATEADLIEEPMAAALGAGLPVFDATGCMVVNIGGGTSEVAVLSLGDIVTAQSIRVAGDNLNAAISNYVRRKYNLLIGERTAEQLKVQIGSALPYDDETSVEVKGRNQIDGLPKTVSISSAEVREAMSDQVLSIVDTVRTTLEKTPPELAADIMDRGITLTGGGALLRGIDRLIEEETGMPVTIAANPLDCVALGTAKHLELNNSFDTYNYKRGRRFR